MAVAVKKLLIVGPSWVGDMVMAQSLFMVLRQRYPDCQIDVLAPPWSLPILERMPEVHGGLEMPIGHGRLALSERYALGKALRTVGYDQAIVLPNSLKSALVPLFAGIPLRTGWRGEMRYGLLNDIRLLIKRYYPLMVQRFVALAYDSGLMFNDTRLQIDRIPFPALQIDAGNVRALNQRFNVQPDVPLLALCPGAEFGSAKRWPEEHYARVASVVIERGWQVALFGSDNDSDVSAAIIQNLPAAQRERCINLAGATTLSQAVDLLSQATVIVSNDSGLMHIGAALRRPMVVVYGSTSAEFTPPLSARVVIEQANVQCRPCFKRECPLSEKQGRLACLLQIKPDAVIRALDSLL